MQGTIRKASANQWMDLSGIEAVDISETCTKETLDAALEGCLGAKTKSIELRDDLEGWPAHYLVTVEHDWHGVEVGTFVYLPLVWNGRLFGTLGGGSRSLMLGNFGPAWISGTALNAVQNGFAGVECDAGVKNGPERWLEWGLDEQSGAFDNHERLMLHAFLAPHQMTLIARRVIEAAYGRPAERSYLQGASNGGRQSLMEAQLYPEDYDGYVACDPAHNYVDCFMEMLWPVVVMQSEKHVIAPAKLETFRKAVIEQYGNGHGIVEDVDHFDFDFSKLVGVQTEEGPITPDDARVAKAIHDGPRTADGRKLANGVSPGTKFWNLLNPGEIGYVEYIPQEDGYKVKPGDFTLLFVGSWLARDKNWDYTTLTYDGFEELYRRAQLEFGCTNATSADLTRLRDLGAKLLISHNSFDTGEVTRDTIDYYRKVTRLMGGEDATAEFARLFITPSGNHTLLFEPGLGLCLAESMSAIMRWVEEGQVPEEVEGVTLDAMTGKVTLSGIVPRYRLDGANVAHDIEVL